MMFWTGSCNGFERGLLFEVVPRDERCRPGGAILAEAAGRGRIDEMRVGVGVDVSSGVERGARVLAVREGQGGSHSRVERGSRQLSSGDSEGGVRGSKLTASASREARSPPADDGEGSTGDWVGITVAGSWSM